MRDAEGNPVESIGSLSGLSQNSPALAAAFAMFMFSLAGIPPLFGFMGKFYVFQAATNAGLYPLAVFGALGSVIGAYYYIRIVKTMYFDAAAPGYAPVDRLEGALIAVLALAISPLGYLSLPFLMPWAGAAAKALF
jgi:NADH-quinone oxidoreductase subunit N